MELLLIMGALANFDLDGANDVDPLIAFDHPLEIETLLVFAATCRNPDRAIDEYGHALISFSLRSR